VGGFPKRLLGRFALAASATALLAPGGCDQDATSPAASPTDTTAEKGSWAVYTPFDWSHDGSPRGASFLTVYSDAASPALKKEVAQIAEERLQQILQLFDFHHPEDFLLPPGYSDLSIYINRNHSENINWAYWGGFIITIRSPDLSGRWRNYTIYTVRHELLHDFEFLIEGRPGLGTDMWFREGLATYVGCLEDIGWDTIDTLQELEAWVAQNQGLPGGGNPIPIHENEDVPTGADLHQFYRLFELVVRYLLEEDGLGRSFQDVLGTFYDARAGIPFAVSFPARFGIGLAELEEGLFERLRAYLADASLTSQGSPWRDG
jgi:hypothetical protein